MRFILASPKLLRPADLPFVAACIAIYAVSDMPRPPVPDVMSFAFSDKLMHALAYGALSWLAVFGRIARRGVVARAFYEAWLLAAIYGGFDECHQSFVPHRSASVGDLVADASGAALALWGLWRLRHRFRALRGARERP